MSYSVEFSKRALREFETIPKNARETLAPIISSLADNPRPPGVRSMKELDKCYRLRHGDYRVIYAVYDKVLIVLVLAVANRREAYTRREMAAIRQELRRRLRQGK